MRKKSNSTSEATAGDHHNNPNISLAKRALLQAAKAQKEANEAHAANIPESQRRQHPEASIEVKQAPSLELDDMQEIEAEEEHAMRIAELVMEQEELYGVNMYDCLEPADEDKIEELVGLGYTVDDAILHIFEEKVVIPLERPTTPVSVVCSSIPYSISDLFYYFPLLAIPSFESIVTSLQ